MRAASISCLDKHPKPATTHSNTPNQPQPIQSKSFDPHTPNYPTNRPRRVVPGLARTPPRPSSSTTARSPLVLPFAERSATPTTHDLDRDLELAHPPKPTSHGLGGRRRPVAATTAAAQDALAGAPEAALAGVGPRRAPAHRAAQAVSECACLVPGCDRCMCIFMELWPLALAFFFWGVMKNETRSVYIERAGRTLLPGPR